MQEQWRPVVGFEGEYEVSDLGRVRSVDRVATYVCRYKGRILRPGNGSHGYPAVVIKGRTFLLHDLVLTAFRGKRPRGFQGCHDNGDRTDARLDNLRWDTPAANNADKIRHGTASRGSKQYGCKLTERDAKEIRRLKGVVSQQALARRFKVSPAAIQAIHDNRTWKHV